MSKLNWIKTKDQKPTSATGVLCLCRNREGKTYFQNAMYAPLTTFTPEDLFGFAEELDTDYDESLDEFFLVEGWFETSQIAETVYFIVDEVVAWAELPNSEDLLGELGSV